MDEIEMRGVVKNGQVVLEQPLEVPDGTEVYVEVLAEEKQHDPEAARQAVLAFIRDPEVREQLEAESR